MARLAGGTALAFTLLLRAQTPVQEVAIRTHAYTPPSTILRVESNLVETPLTVRDFIGHTIGGLHASDFEVFDNDVPQQITAFSEVRADAQPHAAARSEPKYVTFFFDDTHMGRFDLPFVKQAARKFIAKGVKPADRLSIATTSGAGALDFTVDAKLFADGLEHLNLHAHIIHSIEEYQADSISSLGELAAAAKKLSQAPGARILVLMSSGFIIHVGDEHDVEPELQKVVDAAVRWNVVIHAIDAKGLSTSATWKVNRPLKELAQGTGGHLFENTNDIAGSMALAANPEITYQLAFTPQGHDGKFHQLKIRYKSKNGEAAEYRPVYHSLSGNSDQKLTARAPYDDAVFSKQTLSDFPAAVTLTTGQANGNAIPVSFGVTVDVNRLSFATANGRHMQQIAFLITLLDANGNFVTGKESIMDLALTDGKLALLKKTGLKTVATLNAPSGVYQARTVVREGMSGGLSASTTGMDLRAR